jgi:hypothetical protein
MLIKISIRSYRLNNYTIESLSKPFEYTQIIQPETLSYLTSLILAKNYIFKVCDSVGERKK